MQVELSPHEVLMLKEPMELASYPGRDAFKVVRGAMALYDKLATQAGEDAGTTDLAEPRQ